jgi:hypothetical protein
LTKEISEIEDKIESIIAGIQKKSKSTVRLSRKCRMTWRLLSKLTNQNRSQVLNLHSVEKA